MVKGRQGERVRYFFLTFSFKYNHDCIFSLLCVFRIWIDVILIFDCCRLYVRGSILGYKRSKSNQYPNTSLIQIEGVNSNEEVSWYLGKRMAYIYKAKVKQNGSHYRCIWGKVTRPHGNSGVVRAKFKSNLPPKSMVIHVFSFQLILSFAPLLEMIWLFL